MSTLFAYVYIIALSGLKVVTTEIVVANIVI